MRSLTIKTHSESKREYEFFQAILTLAGAVLTHDWQIVDTDPADVVLISFDSSEPYSAWDEYAQKYPVERLIAYTDEHTVKGAHWHIQRAPESMPRLSDVVRVLNSAASHFSVGAPLPATSSADAPRLGIRQPLGRAIENGTGCFHIDQHLAGTLQKAIDGGQCLVCQMPGCLPVYVSPKENSAYTAANPTALSALCRADISQVEVRGLQEEELHKEVASWDKIKRRSLAEFLWFSVLTGSNGRLLAGCDLDEPVHLREWPGHVRLSFYGMYHDIVTHMADGIASLAEVAHRSAAPIQNVIDLHNACAYHGLILRGEEGHRMVKRKTKARENLRTTLKPFAAANGYVKLVIVGSVGAGKTTALTALSETPPILTEAHPSDMLATRKATTTVAMEYGEIRLHASAKLQIYGTPGQKRFDFMGEILCARAWGVLILIDNADPDPLVELKYYLEIYADNLAGTNIAVGVSRYDLTRYPPIEAYEKFLMDNGYPFPVRIVDTRDIHSLAALVAAIAENQKQTPLPIYFNKSRRGLTHGETR